MEAGVAGTCSESGGSVTWSFDNPVAIGTTGTVSLQVQVNGAAVDPVLNTVSIVWADAFGNLYAPVEATDSDALVPTDLSLTKTSDAPVDLEPGDTISYTIEVENASSTPQTNVAVTDPLPAGTTYVAESTSITYDEPVSTATFSDDFESGNFTGGTGAWGSNWLEIGESNGASSGDVRVVTDSGDRSLRIRDNDNGGEGVQRAIDLSSYSTATLSFDYSPRGLDTSNDYATIDVSTNGGSSWTELGRISGPASSFVYFPLAFSLDSYLTANTRIRFLTSPTMGGNDQVLFDDLSIVCIRNRSGYPHQHRSRPCSAHQRHSAGSRRRRRRDRSVRWRDRDGYFSGDGR